ncbi:amino acid adenylation domain-containing protein [Microcoleus sp. LEGE 07076]|uniref:non-ribosomal peptide synthetase n=1 Tax=Microcoleus sp. LEGE 07076 TaxID=915322 RepID=UPI001882A869|nr:non-ribosomal peptide synthetase [Microcoleus sp. LEGE 07076]MBE9185299.1 amino acid adenylation domain-containing protein [Microcoleus sp. LEGE 07076]
MTQYFSDNSLPAGEEKLNLPEETEVFVFPASFAQQRLWFLNQLAPGNPFYNVSTALRLTGSLNFIALEQTFNEIVQRHETLRTTFTLLEGELVQVIAPILTVPLPTIDLQNLSPAQQETAALQLATDAAQCPFDLAAGPLFKVTLLQLGETEHILLLNLHHIVADGWSIGVLIRELGTLYTAFVKNEREAKLSRRESHLPELPVQYADFAEWQHQYLQGEVLATQLAYWRQQLNGITTLNLPTDRQRPAVPSYRGAKHLITLSPVLSEQLKSLSQQESATLFMTLLAAFQTLLYRYTGQVDIAVGTPIANRNKSEIEALIGFFVNSLVLRTDLSGNPTFRELLHRVKNVAVAAYAHQDLPFEKLVEELQPDRELSRNPLFQLSFSLQNTPVAALELPGITLRAIPYGIATLHDFDSGTAKLDLECNLWEDAGSIQGQIVYTTDLFDRATIARMAEHFQTLLKAIVANPQQRLSDLTLLTAPEYQQLLIDWNDTHRDHPQNQCFHQLFEERVELAPNAVAAVFENQQLTYRQLNSRANQLARYLQQLGAKPEVLIGLCLERSLEAIVGLLGIIKAGAAYLPLDPTYPQERLNFILKDAVVPILVTQQHLANNLTAPESLGIFTVVCLDSDLENIARESPTNLTTNILPKNLAYVIYTSGSTGKPKGVLIEHRGLYNLAKAQIEAFQVSSNHRILQFASLSFDASIFEIVMALGTGATLYCAKKESLLPGQTLIQFLQDNAITHATLPPSLLAVLPSAELPALQTIICAGESCSPDIVKCWASGRRFFNAYGPTEATVWSSLAEIGECKKPPIGRPIPNTQLYILDENLQPVPVGIPGELYIGGRGLARGYLNRPELTSQRFIANPFSQKAGKRIYKTGDLASYFPDGNIEFLGRTDEQVKIRGYRIELGEIEALLVQHPAVKETVAVAGDDLSGNKRLVAYVVTHQNQTLNRGEMRHFLKQQLPNYMIPNAFVAIDFLPLTPNGKIDRLRLPAPGNLTSNSIDKSCIAPRTPTESTLAQIWATILNTEPVGIDDNFFDLGGDSLLAIRLINEINQQFERELPLSALFLNPTIEGLADSLSSGTKSLEWSPLVAIKPGGKKPPFFCVHPIFGVIFPYCELAFKLGENQPFYGLQPKGIDGESSPLTRIEDMAADYIAALRTVQPKGPYFLGGWSFGGLVAFEMAQQLLAAGDEVALLAVLDTLAPVAANKPSVWDGCKFILTTVSRSIWPFIVDYFRLVAAAENVVQVGGIVGRFPKLNKLLNWTAHFWHGWNWKQAVMVSILSRESKEHNWRELAIPSMFTVFGANSQATLSYVPKIYPHRITLFRSGEKLSTSQQDPTLGWSELTTEQVEVIRVPGNHLTMLRKPNVEVLARQLKYCLDRELSD